MSGIVYACIAPHPPIIVPEIGRGRESETSRTIAALSLVAAEMASLQPEVVLIISPHGPVHPAGVGILTAPRAQGSMARWGAPEVRFDFANDREAVDLLQLAAETADVPLIGIERWDDGAVEGLDWGCSVPLYHLRPGVGDATLVPLTPCFGTPEYHYETGKAIGQALARLGKRAAIICSADLSHCLLPDAPGGYNPAGREFDEAYQDAIATWDVDWVLSAGREFRGRAAEDAIPQTAMLMGALSEYGLRSRVLSYEGPFGVGYLVAAVDIAEPASEAVESIAVEEPAATPAAAPAHPFVLLAKQAVESYVRAEGSRWPQELSVEIEPTIESDCPAATFVCIKKGGELRGCIGTIEPTQENVGLEIVRNAVAACSHDPRFLPVTRDELDYLTYTVDVLTPPEPISGPQELDPKRYGVIVEQGARRGLLLPDLDGVDSAADQVRIARSKAGIADGEPVRLYRFEVQRYV